MSPSACAPSRARERLPEAQIKKKVDTLLDLVQLGWLADRYPSQLSGGQRQRIALARALAIEPRVLLLDEPFGALDAKVRKELRRWLRNLHTEIHVTSVFVTHDQEEALEVADRVVVMDKGRIEQVGTPEDVYERPQTAFVHEFIGESIVVPVSVDAGSVSFEGKRLNIDAPEISSGKANLFVRPYEMNIVAADAADLRGIVGACTASARRGAWTSHSAAKSTAGSSRSTRRARAISRSASRSGSCRSNTGCSPIIADAQAALICPFSPPKNRAGRHRDGRRRAGRPSPVRADAVALLEINLPDEVVDRIAARGERALDADALVARQLHVVGGPFAGERRRRRAAGRRDARSRAHRRPTCCSA